MVVLVVVVVVLYRLCTVGNLVALCILRGSVRLEWLWLEMMNANTISRSGGACA